MSRFSGYFQQAKDLLRGGFSCEVVHISLTPIIGGPVQIVRGLNKYSKVKARAVTINNYTSGLSFPHDLRWWIAEERDEAVENIKSADIIHFHHWIELEKASASFGFDLKDMLRRGKHIIRQYHSNLDFVAQQGGVSPEIILNDPLPQMVLPQGHERYYPRARLGPAIILLDEPPCINLKKTSQDGSLSIYYRPSNHTGAWEGRWETKGAPEVETILHNVKMGMPGKLRIDCEMKYVSYEENLCRRAACQLTIDDVVNGTNHRASLESMAQGLAVVCYLDPRQVLTMTALTGCKYLPFINFSLEELPALIPYLAERPDLVAQIGRQSRLWMEKYWHPADMVAHYVKAYYDLLTKEPKSFCEPLFDDTNADAGRWLIQESEDLRWELRRQMAMSQHWAGRRDKI